MGSVAVAYGLSCPLAHGIFLDQESNLCPPALAGGYLTTGPPRKYFPFPKKLKKKKTSSVVPDFVRELTNEADLGDIEMSLGNASRMWDLNTSEL